jgi:hypothetical protein
VSCLSGLLPPPPRALTAASVLGLCSFCSLDPCSRRGGKTLVVAVHAPWASVWRATAEALAKADPAVYDIMLIDADRDKQAVRDLGVDIIPTVIVYKDGPEIGRRPNLMSLDQLP